MSGDFRSYYEAEVRPVLAALEERRRRAGRAWSMVAGAIALLTGTAAAVAAALSSWGFAIGAVILGAICLLGGWHLLFRSIIRRAKVAIIGALARFIDPSLRYEPDRYITKAEFRQSGLFRDSINRYRGEDLFWGRVGSTGIRFSEVHAQHRQSSAGSKGTHTTYRTIFKGLFIIADFNKHFRGMTVVLPDVAERTLGWFGQKLQDTFDVFRRGELVKLEDPEFEREFVVYGDDQVEARYILTPALMQRLVEFKRKAGRQVYFSFALSNVYIAIETDKDMFEPRMFRSFLHEEVVLEHLRDLQFATSVVKDLDLNTRIWSKE